MRNKHPSTHPSTHPSFSSSPNPPTSPPPKIPSTTHHPGKITLHPAQRTDIPALISVAIEASRPAVIQHLFTPTPALEEEGRRREEREVAKHWGRAGVEVWKAVWRADKEGDEGDEEGEKGGDVVALCVWQWRGYGFEVEGEGDGEEMEGEDVIGGGGIFFNTLLNHTNPISISNSNSKNKTSALATHLQTQFNSFLTSWTSPTKHLYLSGLYTHPSFQRRGIGTAFLNYGHEKADREGVPSFLIASAMGRPLYTHKGWKEVGGVSVDLKDWVEGAEGGDAGWGVYRYAFMVKMPRTGAKGNIGDEEVRG